MLHLALLIVLTQAPAAKGACALLTNDDVKRVLSVDVKERKPGTQEARGLLLQQCFVETGTARSVSVAVAGPTKSGGRTITPREFWREQFHARREAGDGTREGEAARLEAGEGESAARPIAGIGDEAFWSGTRIAGALYVLHGRTFIRVSVGGVQDERERIEKSRQLAAAALAHLSK